MCSRLQVNDKKVGFVSKHTFILTSAPSTAWITYHFRHLSLVVASDFLHSPEQFEEHLKLAIKQGQPADLALFLRSHVFLHLQAHNHIAAYIYRERINV